MARGEASFSHCHNSRRRRARCHARRERVRTPREKDGGGGAVGRRRAEGEGRRHKDVSSCFHDFHSSPFSSSPSHPKPTWEPSAPLAEADTRTGMRRGALGRRGRKKNDPAEMGRTDGKNMAVGITGRPARRASHVELKMGGPTPPATDDRLANPISAKRSVISVWL